MLKNTIMRLMKIKNFTDIKSLLFENKGTKQTIFKNTFSIAIAIAVTEIYYAEFF